MKYTRHNYDIHKMSAFSLARQTLWSKRTYVEIRGLIELHQPDVMHCTNTFPLISPAVYSAARDGGVPVSANAASISAAS